MVLNVKNIIIEIHCTTVYFAAMIINVYKYQVYKYYPWGSAILHI